MLNLYKIRCHRLSNTMKKKKSIDACIQGCYTEFNNGNEGVAFLCRKIFLEEGEI